ncbi:PAS domain S-box protein [Psychroflexus sediminis]|uniref:histidine kinase n=1 Tax=Psychroflexus sediminis TaxID=470826 RepID=A0A1G7TUZ7_9FLAO|nr:PAS domain S-box protein [Psychroflexus sediminis]SDG39082.1 PAS domain S-box-containing protein [Psychroflexus sediminis]
MLQAYAQLRDLLNFFESPAFLISVIDNDFSVVEVNDKLNAISKRDHNFDENENLADFLKVTFTADTAEVSRFIKKLKLSDPTRLNKFLFNNRSYKFECKPLNFEDRTFIFVAVESLQVRRKTYQPTEVRFFKKIFDSLPIGIAVSRIDDSKALYVNSKFSEIYGWEIDELNNVTAFFEKVYPDEQVRERLKKMILNDIESGDPKRMNWENLTITTSTGQRKIVNAKNIPLREQNLMISTVTDVTKNYTVQREIEKAKVRFDLAARATSDAVWEWDLDKEELYWGDGYKRLFGYKIHNNKVSKAFWESKIHPNDLPSFSQSLKEALNDPHLFKWTFDYRFLDSGNNYASVRENVVIVRNTKGEPLRLVGALQDITKPLKREKHLNLLEKLVDGTKDAILVTEVKSNSFLESEIVYVNSSFQDLFGFDVAQIIGKTPQEFYVTPKNAEMFLELEAELSQWNSVDADILSYTKTNLEFWNNLSITPIVNDEGWYTHWMILNRNVNDLKTSIEKRKLLTFTHRAFQGDDSIESALCKISLKIEGLIGSEFCEFWLVDHHSEGLSESLRFKEGEQVDRDSELLNYRSEDFANTIFETDESQILIHENESNSKEKNDIKLSYGFQIRSHEECLGVIILGFRDTYSRELTLRAIFDEFSIQLANEISRKRTEKEMSTFFEFTPDFLCIAGKNDYLKKINNRACEILGYSSEIVLTTPLLEFIEKEDRHKALKLLNKARENKGYFSDELGVISQNFGMLRVDWTVFSLESSDDLFCVGRDITAYKKNLEQLKTQNEKFKIVSETVKDAVWDFDMLTEKMKWGKGLKTLFGYDPEAFEVSEKIWLEKLHPEDRKRVKESFNSAVWQTQKNEWREEYRFKKQDGSYAYVLDRGKIIRDDKAKALRMVGSLQDISEYRDYQLKLENLNQKLVKQTESLAKSNKDLEEFAYIASHDLQEPLRMVTGFLTRLEQKYGEDLDAKGKEYVNFAVDGAKRMRQIILGLLNFSKVGRQNLAWTKVDVASVIEEVESLLHEAIKEKNAKIETGNLPVVFSVEDELKEVFLNLIENSIKYAQSNAVPQVKIDYEESPNYHRFSVKDNGIGISQEYHDKIFGIFQRLHGHSEYSGTGIGLAIVKKIIHNLGGSISLESELDKGTKFLIKLPKTLKKK